MKSVSRFIRIYEQEKYEGVFAKPTFTDVLNELNLIEPEKADIVKVLLSDERGTVTETNKLLDFGDNFKTI